MRNKFLKITLLLCALIAIAVGVSLFFPAKPPIPQKPLPDPNGYDALIQAARLTTRSASDYRKLNQAELTAVVEANSNALHLASFALQQESRVPIQFTTAYMSSHMEELAGVKGLAQAWSAEGRLAEMESRPADAAGAYVETIRMGMQSGRGGVLIDDLVAIAVEAIGTANLRALVPQLDEKTCRNTAGILEKLDAGRVPWQEILDQEREWGGRTYPGLRERIAALFSQKSIAAAKKKAESKFKAQQSSLRRLSVQLAARAYQLEKGAAPKSISELVPEFLRAVPVDPVTGTNMVYAP